MRSGRLRPPYTPHAMVLRFLALRLQWRRLWRSLSRRLHHEEWGVGLVRQPLPSLLGAEGPLEIEWLHATPPASFRADPFGLETGPAVFFEEWDPELGRGRIAAAALSAEGEAGASVPIFDAPHHLSYPCLFTWEDALYSVPECSEAREVVLYRCQGDPLVQGDWERVATLLEGEAVVDATPFHHEGRWWMWCAAAEGDAATRLRLFLADELTGPWREHPRSPLKVDVRSSRPAGAPFVHEGALYRPAQDCSQGYGGAVVVLRVDTLSEKDYAETPVARIAPDPGGPLSGRSPHPVGPGGLDPGGWQALDRASGPALRSLIQRGPLPLSTPSSRRYCQRCRSRRKSRSS